MSRFPHVIYGICSRCGEKAADNQTPNAGGGTANADDDLETGNGTELIMFRGDYICRICKEDIISDEASIRSAQRHAEEQRFRDQVGFTKTIS